MSRKKKPAKRINVPPSVVERHTLGELISIMARVEEDCRRHNREAESLERQGRRQEAEEHRRHAERAAARVPRWPILRRLSSILNYLAGGLGWDSEGLIFIRDMRVAEGGITVEQADGTCLDALTEALAEGILAEEKQAGPISVAQPKLGPVASAVLNLILAQPKGAGISGKEICAALARSNQPFNITVSYLKRHIVPALKVHGVRNSKAQGGYLLPVQAEPQGSAPCASFNSSGPAGSLSLAVNRLTPARFPCFSRQSLNSPTGSASPSGLSADWRTASAALSASARASD